MTDTLFSEVRELILAARKTVSRGVDIVQILTNYEIGRRIVEYEQEGAERAAYGKQVLKALSARLGEEFGRGFSRSNLEYMREFYLTYRDRLPGKSQTPSGKLIESGKSQTLSGKTDAVVFMEKVLVQNSRLFQLSWSQYVFLMSIGNPDERNFYEIEAASNGWSLREFKRQYNAGLYERLALSRDKDGIRKLAKEGQVIAMTEPDFGSDLGGITTRAEPDGDGRVSVSNERYPKRASIGLINGLLVVQAVGEVT